MKDDTVEGTQLQARHDDAYRALGSEAPRRQYGESVELYHRRLLSPLLKNSQWRDVNLYKVPDALLPVIEKDAVRGTIDQSRSTEGPLRMVSRRDQAGRTINEFFGDETAAWKPFSNPDMLGVIRGPR